MFPGGPNHPYPPFSVPSLSYSSVYPLVYPPVYPLVYSPVQPTTTATQGEVMLRWELLKEKFFSCLSEKGVRPNWT